MHRVLFKSVSPNWTTPDSLFQLLDREFRFDLDPCKFLSEEDGLLTCWQRRRVFCNPPYGPGLNKWLTKAKEAKVAVFLIPSRTDTKWFHDLVLPHAREIRFVRGRLKFGGAKHNAPFPSMVVIYGRSRSRHHAQLPGGHFTGPVP